MARSAWILASCRGAGPHRPRLRHLPLPDRGRCARRRPGQHPWAEPGSPRGGALARIEDRQWLLTLAGVLGDRPPTDVDGFLDFARSLHSPDIYRAIREAEPIGKPVAFRFPASVRRRYERLRQIPDGLVPLGDAVCSFNPVYGQGMTVAALQAVALRSQLGVHRMKARRVIAATARVINTPWEMAAGADLAFPRAQGRRTQRQRLIGSYVSRLHAAAHDATLAVAFMRVAGLVDHPATLLRPSIAARVAHSTSPRLHDPREETDQRVQAHGG